MEVADLEKGHGSHHIFMIKRNLTAENNYFRSQAP